MNCYERKPDYTLIARKHWVELASRLHFLGLIQAVAIWWAAANTRSAKVGRAVAQPCARSYVQLNPHLVAESARKLRKYNAPTTCKSCRVTPSGFKDETVQTLSLLLSPEQSF